MLGIHDYGVFVAAGILLNLTPGQDTFYILGRSIAHGQRIGVVSVLGVSAGTVVHTGLAALGLSAILATSAAAFTVLKLAGAAYLIYLGVGILSSHARVAETTLGAEVPGDAATAFRQGMLSNLLNPKVALFFLAFMPQFIDPASETKVAAFLVLGATLITTGTIWCLVLAVAGARMRDVMVQRGGVGGMLTRASGAVFVALGVRLAVSTR